MAFTIKNKVQSPVHSCFHHILTLCNLDLFRQVTAKPCPSGKGVIWICSCGLAQREMSLCRHILLIIGRAPDPNYFPPQCMKVYMQMCLDCNDYLKEAQKKQEEINANGGVTIPGSFPHRVPDFVVDCFMNTASTPKLRLPSAPSPICSAASKPIATATPSPTCRTTDSTYSLDESLTQYLKGPNLETGMFSRLKEKIGTISSNCISLDICQKVDKMVDEVVVKSIRMAGEASSPQGASGPLGFGTLDKRKRDSRKSAFPYSQSRKKAKRHGFVSTQCSPLFKSLNSTEKTLTPAIKPTISVIDLTVDSDSSDSNDDDSPLPPPRRRPLRKKCTIHIESKPLTSPSCTSLQYLDSDSDDDDLFLSVGLKKK